MVSQQTHALTCNTVDGVGFDGAARYGNIDMPFDVSKYAELVGINVSDIDPNSIDAMNDAASHEGPESWIKVSHSTEGV